MELEHEYRAEVSLVLMSPAGTRSNILSHRRLDNSSDGIDFTFMTVHHWGEDPAGTWTLEVEDRPRDGSRSSVAEGGTASSRRHHGRLLSWSLVLYGVAGDRPNHHSVENSNDATHQSPSAAPDDPDSSEQARHVGSSEIKELMEKEAESSDSVQIQSKDEVAAKRNEGRRKWLLKRGFSREDVDFLIELFETEQEEKRTSAGDNPAEHKRSEIPSYRGNGRYDGNSRSQNEWWRRTYDTGGRSQWNPPRKGRLGSIDGSHERIVDQDAFNGSTNGELLRALVDELAAFLDDE